MYFGLAPADLPGPEDMHTHTHKPFIKFDVCHGPTGQKNRILVTVAKRARFRRRNRISRASPRRALTFPRS